MSVLGKKELVELYGRRARNYDVTANLYYLLGFREFSYRRKAVDALALRPGDTVVEIGCGTGLNFPLMQRYVGPTGKIIGVDLTDSMLERARERARDNRWNNVELVHADAAMYDFPGDVDGIISTFAITLIPEFDKIIRRGSASLVQGGRLVILDFKMPGTRMKALAPVLVYLTKPFGVSIELCERHPWESLASCLSGVEIEEYYGGFVYIAAGEKGLR